MNFITTLLNMRTRGMSLMRMPLTCWSWFTTAILALLSFPVLLAGGILLLLDSTQTGPINCGTEHEMSMRQLAETIAVLAGSSSPVTYVPRAVDDPEKRRPDLTLARTLLGYEPQVGSEDGLRRTIRYFAERVQN